MLFPEKCYIAKEKGSNAYQGYSSKSRVTQWQRQKEPIAHQSSL